MDKDRFLAITKLPLGEPGIATIYGVAISEMDEEMLRSALQWVFYTYGKDTGRVFLPRS